MYITYKFKIISMRECAHIAFTHGIHDPGSVENTALADSQNSSQDTSPIFQSRQPPESHWPQAHGINLDGSGTQGESKLQS